MLKKILLTGAALALTSLGLVPKLSRGQNAPKSSQPHLNASDIDKMMSELSNWGRWGNDDQRGALNLITPAKRKQAAALVREGISVSLAHDFSAEKAADNTRPLEFTMTLIQPVAMEELKIFYHGLTYAHMDAMCHARYKEKAYNGFGASLTTEKGCAKGGVENLKEGILSRGILIDVPRLKGVPFLDGAVPVLAGDIEAWEQKANVRIGSGDVVLIRTGRWAKRAASGPFNMQGASPGVHVSLLPLLKARDAAVLGTDVGLDVTPPGVDGVVIPTHTVAIVGMGLLIVDNADLEALAETAARLNRWEFMFTAAPLPVVGATGSPLNAIATF
jgi:kynurenine formamidase